MNSEVFFVSNKIGKGLFFAQRDVIVKSYCTPSRSCSQNDHCHDCALTDQAKKYLENRTSNSDIKTLDSELAVGIGEVKIG